MNNLEIEIQTVLRGPLADKLNKLSAAAYKSPVDFAADILISALTNEASPAILARRHYQLKKQLERLRYFYNRLIAERKPVAPTLLMFSPAANDVLVTEASKRGITPMALAKSVVELVCTDKLFTAVLDG